MKFLVDAQLPPGLAGWLIEKGHTATHVDDVLLTTAKDSDIWDHALKDGSIIVTKDEDFSARRSRMTEGPAVLWLRIGNATNRSLFKWLEPRWESVVQLLREGNHLVEVR
ncbi:MAG TPA: DUF5615 family PIN-like protein [Pyrinomonadaceae bacterium]|nr:DUF5615 family PIN-like protein [Pyrinomonadaceae bacterium]